MREWNNISKWLRLLRSSLFVAEVTLLLMNILPVFKVFRKTVHSLASSYDDQIV